MKKKVDEPRAPELRQRQHCCTVSKHYQERKMVVSGQIKTDLSYFTKKEMSAETKIYILSDKIPLKIK